MPDMLHRLDGPHSTLILMERTSPPAMVYWGPKLADTASIEDLAVISQRPFGAGVAGSPTDRYPAPISLMPHIGDGAFGTPGLTVSRDGKDAAIDLTTESISKADNGLTIHLLDEAGGVEVTITLTIDPASDVLLQDVMLTNQGDSPLALHHLAAVLPCPAHFEERLSFDGRFMFEFQESRAPIGLHSWVQENRKGRTGHDTFPGFVVGTKGFDESRGDVIAAHLGWSGNHHLRIERQHDGQGQMQLAPLLDPTEVILRPGESFQNPTAVFARSDAGLNGVRQRLHSYVRDRLLTHAKKPRPVHLNTWEAVWFDHDLDQLKTMASKAASIGIERFVLDDGWFRGRFHDRAGLGDWTACPDRYPDGLQPLIDHVKREGMEFGLWVEPEMVNPDSDLYRAHPDWVLGNDRRRQSWMRWQLLLDLTKEEVAQYLFDAINALLTNHDIAYLKWDMNRHYGVATSQGFPAAHAQTEALYDLLDRLRTAHPDAEIESCASGGARVDYGILKRTDRFWASDATDAMDRQHIQAGMGLFFPPEVIGAHVGTGQLSDLGAHLYTRDMGIPFRCLTALFGHMGVEADVTKLSDDKAAQLAEGIALYKDWRGLIHSGAQSVLPGSDRFGRGQMVMAEDRSEALALWAEVETRNQSLPPPLRLVGLEEGASYCVKLISTTRDQTSASWAAYDGLAGDGLTLPGAVLKGPGLTLPHMPSASAMLFHIRKL